MLGCLSRSIFELESSILLKSFHIRPILREVGWIECPRSNIGWKFDFEVLQAELILVSCFNLLATYLFDCKFGNGWKFLLRQKLFTFLYLSQTHKTLGTLPIFDWFRRDIVNHFKILSRMFQFNFYVLQNGWLQVVLYLKFCNESLVKEEKSQSNAKIILVITNSYWFVYFL